jgi:hypothetical protein
MLQLSGTQSTAAAAGAAAAAAGLEGLEDRLIAGGESVIKYKSPLNVLKDTYDYRCY